MFTEAWHVNEVPILELDKCYQRYIAIIIASLYIDTLLKEFQLASISCISSMAELDLLEKKLDLKKIFMSRTSNKAVNDEIYEHEIQDLKNIKRLQQEAKFQLKYIKEENQIFQKIDKNKIDSFFQKIEELEKDPKNEILILKEV